MPEQDKHVKRLSISFMFGALTSALLMLYPKRPSSKSPTKISPENDADESDNKPGDLALLSSELAPSPQCADKTCKCCHHKTPWWKVLLDVATCLATIFTAIFLYYYVKDTHDISKQTVRQTELAEGNFRSASYQGELQRRSVAISTKGALVRPKGASAFTFQAGKNIIIWMDLKNDGFRQAAGITVVASSGFLSKTPVVAQAPSQDVPGFVESGLENDRTVITARENIGDGNPSPPQAKFEFPIFPREVIPDYERGKKRFYFWGDIIYSDAIAGGQRTPFCYFTSTAPSDKPVNFGCDCFDSSNAPKECKQKNTN